MPFFALSLKESGPQFWKDNLTWRRALEVALAEQCLTSRAGLSWSPFYAPFRHQPCRAVLLFQSVRFSFENWMQILFLQFPRHPINQNWSLLFEISRFYTIFLACQTLSPPRLIFFFFPSFLGWKRKTRDGRKVKRKSGEGWTHKQWTALERDCVGSFKCLRLFQPVSSTDMDMKSLAN